MDSHLTNTGQGSQLRAELFDKSSNFVGCRLVRDPLLQQGDLQCIIITTIIITIIIITITIIWFDQINANVTELALSGKFWACWWGAGEQKEEQGKEFLHPAWN